MIDTQGGRPSAHLLIHRYNSQLLGLMIVLIIVTAIFSLQLSIPFEFQDDHTIIRYSSVTVHHQVLAQEGTRLYSYWQELKEDSMVKGRFRPLLKAMEVFLPILLGRSAFAWHCAILFLVIATSICLYVLSWLLFKSTLGACCLSLVVTLAPEPGPTAAWYRLGCRAEPVGSFFIVLSMLLLVLATFRRSKTYDNIALLCITVAAFTKESFVFLIPALAYFRLGCEKVRTNTSIRVAFKEVRSQCVYMSVLFIICCFAIGLALYESGASSYGGKSVSTVSVYGVSRAVVRDVLRMPSLAIWFAPCLLAYVQCLLIRVSKQVVYTIEILLIFCALWVIPQVILYSTRDGMWGYYWTPCIIGLGVVNAGAFAALDHLGGKLFRRMALGVFLLWSANAVRIDIAAIVNHAALASTQQALVTTVADGVDNSSRIVIVADPNTQSEIAFSFLYFLGTRDLKTTVVYLYDSQNNDPCFSVIFGFPYQECLRDISPSSVSAVVFLDTGSKVQSRFNSWYVRGSFSETSIMGVYHYLSLRNMTITKLPVRFNAAFRH